MLCPYCGKNETKVVDKRNSPDSIRRRRECSKCGKRFTTHERIEEVEIVVIKRDGSRERFDSDKVRKGIELACEKRPVNEDQIDQIVKRIQRDVKRLKNTEVKSSRIGKMCMRYLKQTDKVAYIRFASVYQDYQLDELQDELEKLQDENSNTR